MCRTASDLCRKGMYSIWVWLILSSTYIQITKRNCGSRMLTHVRDWASCCDEWYSGKIYRSTSDLLVIVKSESAVRAVSNLPKLYLHLVVHSYNDFFVSRHISSKICPAGTGYALFSKAEVLTTSQDDTPNITTAMRECKCFFWLTTFNTSKHGEPLFECELSANFINAIWKCLVKVNYTPGLTVVMLKCCCKTCIDLNTQEISLKSICKENFVDSLRDFGGNGCTMITNPAIGGGREHNDGKPIKMSYKRRVYGHLSSAGIQAFWQSVRLRGGSVARFQASQRMHSRKPTGIQPNSGGRVRWAILSCWNSLKSSKFLSFKPLGSWFWSNVGRVLQRKGVNCNKKVENAFLPFVLLTKLAVHIVKRLL